MSEKEKAIVSEKMNREELVKQLVGIIKSSSDKRVVVKALLKIRSDIVNDRDGIILLQAMGGIAPLTRLLQKPHEEILDLTLSILANSCTAEQVCKEAFGCNVIVPLITILKSIPSDTILCRACRLLGNIAKHHSNELVSYEILVKAICPIIRDSEDVATRLMAVRACRFLLHNAEFWKYFISADGFTYLIDILFTSMQRNGTVTTPTKELEQQPPQFPAKKHHRIKYFEEEEEMLKKADMQINAAYVLPKEKPILDLISDTIKCLAVLSETPFEKSLWTKYNIEPIVCLVGKESRDRNYALKILSNFSRSSTAFSFLSDCNAVVSLCELFCDQNLKKPLVESERRHSINIVRMLSFDSCDRAKIRRSGTLRILLTLMRNDISHTEKSMILQIINNYNYDIMSMELMLNEGLLPVLINELNKFISDDDDYYKSKREDKRQAGMKRKLPIDSSTIDSQSKVSKNDFIPESPDTSPRSPFSPCSSRSMSPMPASFKCETLEDESYSPICSDDEDDENENTEKNSNETVENLSKLLNVENVNWQKNDAEHNDDEEIATNDGKADAEKSAQVNLKGSTIDVIENILLRSTLLTIKRTELGTPKTILTLVKAIKTFGPNNSFPNSLSNILQESQFFVEVVRMGVIHKLDVLANQDETAREATGFLDTLTCVGESNYGKAELARLLRCNNDILKKRAAIAVAYLVRSHRLLSQFLNEGNALNIILDIILSRNFEEFSCEAADAISYMSRNTLGIPLPSSEIYDKQIPIFEDYINRNVTRNDGTSVKIYVHQSNDDNVDDDDDDDDEQRKKEKETVIIEFSRRLLCDSSEVFYAMLNSDFREGNEGEIHLNNYSPSGLKYFLYLIVCKTYNFAYRLPSRENYKMLLEAHEMSRIYIIPDLEAFTQQMLVQLIDHKNCNAIFDWSIRNYHTVLMETVTHFYLSSDLSSDVKVSMFRTASMSNYATQWITMLNDAILSRCIGF